MSKVKVHHQEPLAYLEISNFIQEYVTCDTIIVCIGTDRCIGDAIGPLVGTMLKDSNFPLPVYGTLDSPIHALNIDKHLRDIEKKHPDADILAIDACLGEGDSIGTLQARDYSIHPGKGVGKSLPDVGEASIVAIVDTSDNTELFTNRNIRLSLVYNMSEVIARAVNHAYLTNKKANKLYVNSLGKEKC